MTPHQAASLFLDPDSIVSLQSMEGGNVNSTYLLVDNRQTAYILQRINPEVFPHPDQVIANQETVLSFLHAKGKWPGEGQGRELFLFKTKSGKTSVADDQGGRWRLMNYCHDTHTKTRITTQQTAAAMGQALGNFHILVSDLDPTLLYDPLPGFHIAPLYLKEYDRLADRLSHRPNFMDMEDDDILFCRRFIDQRRRMVPVLEQAARQGILRCQVIHGDPKPANFLFDNITDQVVALIDLDTVKSGPLLYDIGDCLRATCNRAGEEATDPGEARFDISLAQALLHGYITKAGQLLGPEDIRLIHTATRLVSFELGLRFFSDHLRGNAYFSVRYPGHNLKRAVLQFHLVKSIEEKKQDFTAIIEQLTEKLLEGKR